jgi:hypothetical protein
MKQEEVPQDRIDYYAGNRRGLYARDTSGAYAVMPSTGWAAEAVVTVDAAEEYRRLARLALERARRGEASALEYHMYDRRMDPAALAEATGLWSWRVRRHLRPGAFARLPAKLLQRYAEALGLDAAALVLPP